MGLIKKTINICGVILVGVGVLSLVNRNAIVDIKDNVEWIFNPSTTINLKNDEVLNQISNVKEITTTSNEKINLNIHFNYVSNFNILGEKEYTFLTNDSNVVSINVNEFSLYKTLTEFTTYGQFKVFKFTTELLKYDEKYDFYCSTSTGLEYDESTYPSSDYQYILLEGQYDLTKITIVNY